MGQEFPINEALINHYLDLVTPIDGVPLGLLLPPGSGRHSLPLIASGLSQIQGQEIDLLVLLASHPENQTTIQREGRVVSPLGSLEIDSQAADDILSLVPEFKPLKLSSEQRAETIESCFPVLPAFIKLILPEAKILPVLLAEDQLGQAEAVGSALAGMLRGKRACVIAQTELEHSLYSEFEFNHPKSFRKIADDHGNESQVGAAPAAALLQYAQLSGGNTVSTLEEDRSGSVHSAAAMLWNYQPPLINPAQQDELFRLALQAIESYITQGEVPETQFADPVLERKAGVFVTLRIRGMLRGCIGNMSALRPLFQSVQDMAVSAATSDPRFPPLTTKEFNQITIKVAVLSPMQRMQPEQIEVGKHGLLITHYGKRGVLLPEVAAEREWSRETFLENVCRKAGLPGDAWQQGAKIYGFSSVVFGNG